MDKLVGTSPFVDLLFISSDELSESAIALEDAIERVSMQRHKCDSPLAHIPSLNLFTGLKVSNATV